MSDGKFKKGNTEYKKNNNPGRKGFGIENAKKYLLQQSYYILNKSLEKEAKEMPEKEKRIIALEAVKKTLPREFKADFGEDTLDVLEKLTKSILGVKDDENTK